MNLMLTATCDSVDAFHQTYLSIKHEFADWCDSSRCVFAKIVPYGIRNTSQIVPHLFSLLTALRTVSEISQLSSSQTS